MGEASGVRRDEPGHPILDARLRAATAELATRLGLSAREARLEAQVLAAYALGVNRAWLIAHGDESLGPAAMGRLDSLLQRRLAGEPVAYLLGWREFYGRDFRVTPDVLIPRPETELLVEAALARLPGDGAATVLDLGTGSGCIAISLALVRPRCRVTALDVSPAALAVARDNGVRLGAAVEFLQSDWFAVLDGRRFDLIVTNPPYVAEADPHLTQGDLPREPYRALAAGPDGLDALRIIASGAAAHLAPGGWLLAEHGWDQGEVCRSLFAAVGLEQVLTLTDLAGRDRVCIGRTAQ